MSKALIAALLAAAASLAGCTGWFGDFDYSQRRAINSDIAATHEIGPTSLYPGENFTSRSEPLGRYPWQIDERN